MHIKRHAIYECRENQNYRNFKERLYIKLKFYPELISWKRFPTLITINKNKRLCEKNKNLATLPDRFKNLLFVGGELRL